MRSRRALVLLLVLAACVRSTGGAVTCEGVGGGSSAAASSPAYVCYEGVVYYASCARIPESLLGKRLDVDTRDEDRGWETVDGRAVSGFDTKVLIAYRGMRACDEGRDTTSWFAAEDGLDRRGWRQLESAIRSASR